MGIKGRFGRIMGFAWWNFLVLALIVSGWTQSKTNDQQNKRVFQREFRAAVFAVHQNDDSGAVKLLTSLPEGDALAEIYRKTILAKLFIKLGRPLSADSLLDYNTGISSRSWRRYVNGIRLTSLLTYADTSATPPLDKLEKLSDKTLTKFDELNARVAIIKFSGFKGNLKGYEKQFEQILKAGVSNRELKDLYKSAIQKHPVEESDKDISWILLELADQLGENADAVQRCLFLLKQEQSDKKKKRLHLLYCNLLMQQGKYSKAEEAYLEHMQLYGRDATSLRQIARGYGKRGDWTTARKWYAKIVEEFPRSSYATSSAWLLGWEAEAEKDYDLAISYYQQLFPYAEKDNSARWAPFRLAFCQFKSGNFDKALSSFQAAANLNVLSHIQAAASFWIGKTYEELGKKDSAKSQFIKTWEIYTLDFYGQLSRRYLQDKNLGKISDTIFSRTLVGADSVRSWLKANVRNVRYPLSRNLESSWMTIAELLDLKLDSLAHLTFLSMPNSQKQNPWMLWYYAEMFRKGGNHVVAYRIARLLAWKIPLSVWGSAPVEVLRHFYPMVFREEIVWNAGLKGIDPHLVLAVIKQESAFDPGARSWAAATGLMQIIAPTGRFLAKREGIENFDPRQLTSPDLNVRLGTTYIRDLLKEYDHEAIWVLANYNAGPGPAKRWKNETKGAPLEVKVEEISYKETRNYVKRVLGNWWTYRYLYEDG